MKYQDTITKSTVQFSDALKLHGVTLDSTLSFDKHVSNVVRLCAFHALALRQHSSSDDPRMLPEQWLCPSLGLGSTIATTCAVVLRNATSAVSGGSRTSWHVLFSKLCGQAAQVVCYMNYIGCLYDSVFVLRLQPSPTRQNTLICRRPA